MPDEPHLALWHACTLLREHRFDGHVAALTGHDVDGLSSLLIAVAAGSSVDGDTLRSFRGWTEDEWAAGGERKRERGFIDETGALTAAGGELRDAVEESTDRLGASPWEQLEATRREQALRSPRHARPRARG